MQQQLVVTIALLAFSSITRATPQPEPVRLLVNNWASQKVVTSITGELLKKKGYQVEYVSASIQTQWYLLEQGRADIQMEVWQGTMEADYHAFIGKRAIVDAGTHRAVTREEWWYPDYVQDYCPGLPDWRVLNNCLHFFRSNESGRGVFYTGPWERHDHIRIKALGLEYQVIEFKTDRELWDKMKTAVSARDPILIFNWTPNWTNKEFKGDFIEFPTYEEKCESDPTWGLNQDWTWDCGNPRKGWLKKVISTRLATKDPCVKKLIERIDFDNSTLTELSWQREIRNYPTKWVAHEWLENNEHVWNTWLETDCSAPIPNS